MSTATAPQVARVDDATGLEDALGTLGVPRGVPVLVLVGAGKLDDAAAERLTPIFRDVLAPLARALGAAVVDGGTDSGVMQLMGRTRAESPTAFPLVGVAPEGAIEANGHGGVPLELNHSYALLVPGAAFGDESTAIAATATEIAQGMPSATLLLGGGEVSWADVEASIAARRPVLVVSGSGGTANAIAAAVGGADGNSRAAAIAASGLVEVVPARDLPAIGRALGRLLGGQPLHGARPEPALATAPAADYTAWMREDYGGLIDQLELTAFQRQVLRSRWLDQMLWADRAAGRAQRKHYALRVVAIVGGVLIPALVGVSVSGTVGDAARVAAWITGVLVAIAVAADAFFRYGERWRHYRRVAEGLKAEGWLFLELAGPYARYQTHADAVRRFGVKVEGLLAEDVGAYLTTVSREGQGQQAAPADADGKPT
jgi:hypothetical protein